MNDIVANEITEYRYHLNQNGSITLDEYINAEMCYVVVPEEIDGHKVTEIAEGAFENRGNILGMLLPNSITKISDKAFWGCRNLKMICFGSGISWIGNEAFAECIALENLKIPVVLDYLGEYAFALCGLKQIEILGIRDWRPKSFSLCTVLKSFSIKQCKVIPEGAFEYDISLTDVNIENRVESVCETAFNDCRSFEQIIYKYWNYSINDDFITVMEKKTETDDLEASLKQNTIYRKFVRCAKIIVGNYCVLGDDEDMVTADKLYTNIKERKISIEQITTIFPADASAMLNEGKIPVIEMTEVNFEFDEGENLHYFENIILYIPNEDEDNSFSKCYGTIYITGKRIVTQVGDAIYDTPFERLSKIVLYEAMPKILEVCGNNNVLFIQTADTYQTYELSRILMESFEKKPQKLLNMEKLSLDHFKHEDMDVYIFNLKKISEMKIPNDMRSVLIQMINSLSDLNKTLQMYPSHQEQAHRFFTYYIPEVMRLIYSFNEYEKAGVSEERMNPVYDRVMKSIHKVSTAAVQRVDEIYKMATMDTMAKADALQKIIGQDGYAEGDKPLKH